MEAEHNKEDQFYYPSKEIIKRANVKDYDAMYKRSIEDREGFWADEAKKLDWSKSGKLGGGIYGGCECV